MNFKKYIDIPYKHAGRSFKGTDCAGLIQLIYKEEKNIVLPDNFVYDKYWYKEEDVNNNHLLNTISSYNYKVKVNPPFKVFDCLLFWNQKRTYVDHIGMFIEENKFIHTYRNSSSKIDRIEGYWNSRLWGTFRYKEKNCQE